uniref:Uncharacterized protein n=1 Tax=Cacopsylla melanoneura TaxID=428564 RepID=A0A8D8ZD67_9HEMI
MNRTAGMRPHGRMRARQHLVCGQIRTICEQCSEIVGLSLRRMSFSATVSKTPGPQEAYSAVCLLLSSPFSSRMRPIILTCGAQTLWTPPVWCKHATSTSNCSGSG